MRTPKMPRHSQQGFAMTGVLIAAAAGLVVALSVSQMLENMNKTRGAIEFRNTIMDQVEMLRLALITPQFCNHNFAGKVVAGTLSFPSLSNTDGQVLFKAEADAAVGGIYISKMNLIPPAASEDGETFEGQFEVEFTRGAGINAPKKTHSFPFSYFAGPDHKIVNCIISY